MPRATRAAALAFLLLAGDVAAFTMRLPAQQRAPRSKSLLKAHSGRRAAFAAAATALTTGLKANAAPADQRWAASEFFDEVRNGAVDRVTFAAEGGALVAVDCRAESKCHGAFRNATMFPHRSTRTAVATTSQSYSRKSPRRCRLYERSGSPSRCKLLNSRTAAY